MLYGLSATVRYPARTAQMVGVVEIHLGTLAGIRNQMHRTEKLTVFRPDGRRHLFRYRLKGDSQLLDRHFPVHDAVHVIRFKPPTVHLRKALAEQPVGPRVETVGVRQIEAHIQAAVPYAGGNALHARKGGRVLYAVFFHHQLYNEEVCVLLPLMLVHFYSLLQIANLAHRENVMHSSLIWYNVCRRRLCRFGILPPC